jgi:hypothetical protein
VLVSGSVLNHGGLSGRGPLGGVYVHLAANVTARVVSGTSTLLPPTASLWSNNSALAAGITSAASTSGSLGAQLTFAASGGSAAVIEVTVRVGISFVDPAHAWANLIVAQQRPSSEGSSWVDFDDALDATALVWEGYVSRAVVAGAAEAGAAIAAAGEGLAPAARALAYKAARNASGVDPLQVRARSL